MMWIRKMFSRGTIPLGICFFLLSSILPPPVSSMTLKEEREIGEKVLLEVKKRWPIVFEPSVDDYVNRIGQRILRSLEPQPFNYQFFVLNTPEINAFAVPGGKVFLNSGLVLLMDNENELAGVMCHEIGHVVARHIAKRSEQGQAISLATLGAMLAGLLLGGKAAGAIATTSSAAAETAFLKYSRQDEEDADYLGLKFMSRAGYDREGMITMLKKLRRVSGPASGDPPAYLLTHPAAEERAVEMEIQMARFPEEKQVFKPVGNLQRIQTKLVVEERDTSRAITYFENWLKRKPEDSEPLFGLGLAQKRMGGLDRAIENFLKASSLSPGDGEIFRELGTAYFLKANVPEAKKNLEKARSLSPNDAETYFYLGRIYAEQKSIDEALEAFLRARELNPHLPEIQYHLGMAYGAKGMLGQAYRCLGYHYKSLGDGKTALMQFQKALPYFAGPSAEREALEKEIEALTPKKKEPQQPLGRQHRTL